MFDRKYLVRSAAALATTAAVALGVINAPVAHAATATWFQGDACHNVVRTESGGSTMLSRTGQRGYGGNSAGGSWLTVWFGSTWSEFNQISGDVNGPRSYALGKFKVEFSGGVAGECAGASQGAAINVGAPRLVSAADSRLAPPDTTGLPAESSSEVNGYALTAWSLADQGLVRVEASADGYTFGTEFTPQQIAAGEAVFLVGDEAGATALISFTPGSSAASRSTDASNDWTVQTDDVPSSLAQWELQR